MSVVITQNLVLDAVEQEDLVNGLPDYPLIAYNNLVTDSNISASFTLDGYPASNMAAPITFREWRASAGGGQWISIVLDGITQVDYVAIAKHNFGSGQIPVSIEDWTTGSAVTIAGPVIPADDSPLLFRFSPRAMTLVKIFLNAVAAPRAAVVYAGKLLVMQRRIWVGHTPFPHGRKSSASRGWSESGQFLGSVLLGAWRETSAPFRLISPDWYRENMDAFLAVAASTPFFFAWRPASYPLEVGFGGLTDDPVPVPEDSSSNNLLAFTLNMKGVA